MAIKNNIKAVCEWWLNNVPIGLGVIIALIFFNSHYFLCI